MRILVIGAGEVGAQVLRQLQKNTQITIITADPRAKPDAVKQGIVPEVDIHDPLTPFNLEHMIEQVKPDLVLLTGTQEDLGMGTAPGLDLFSDQLREELAALSSVPMIQVARL